MMSFPTIPSAGPGLGGAFAVLAYVDPGTTASLFAFLAPLLALLGVFFGFLLWPFRKALAAVFRRKKGADESQGDGEGATPEAEEKPEGE